MTYIHKRVVRNPHTHTHTHKKKNEHIFTNMHIHTQEEWYDIRTPTHTHIYIHTQMSTYSQTCTYIHRRGGTKFARPQVQ